MTEIDPPTLRRFSQMAGADCPPLKALSDLLDGKIATELMRSLELHLASCPACINRLIDLRELARLQTEGPEPPPALLREVISMVTSERPATLEKETSLFGHGRAIVASIVTAASNFRIALAVGGAAAAAALAIALLHLPEIGPNVVKPSGQLAQESVGGFAQRSLSKRVIFAFAPVSVSSQALNARVLSALESLPKTLLLEQTRDAVDTAVYREAAPATVLVVTDTGLGSGVLISNAGDILTNYHVIRDAKRVVVVFKPERGVDIRKDLAYGAMPIKVDEVTDLAMLRVEAPPRLLHPLSVGDISKLEVGDDVHAIGHPEGEVWTYTTGTISQIRPHYEWKEGDETHRATVIQSQTAINPGNSGGPLLNNKAQVIGINSFRIEGEGLNYAIAGDTVEAFIKRSSSRVAKAPAKGNAKMSRIERFGDHIAGAYLQSKTPPPDTWLVFLGASDIPDYAVMGTSNKNKLDTVFAGVDPKWQEIVYYYDVDCDGTVDLIAYALPGSDKIERYQRPDKPIRLDSLAADLARALDSGLVPYHQVQFCR